jgi:hypothetical protein
MIRARIYCIALAFILLSQVFEALRLPLHAIVGLLIVVGGMAWIEIFEVRMLSTQDREQINDLSAQLHIVRERLSALESTVNLAKGLRR